MSNILVDIKRLSNVTKTYFNNESNLNLFPSKSDVTTTTTTANVNEEPKAKSFIISKGAETFRQKLIDHFAPADRNNKLPSLTANDLVSSDDTIEKILLINPNEKIRFSAYPKINRLRLDDKKIIRAKRYYNKTQILRKNVKRILNSKIVENSLLLLLIFDAFITGISVNLSVKSDKAQYQTNVAAILAFQITSTTIFVLESICRLFIDYKGFFKSPWNIFDISLTILTTLLEIIDFIFFYFKPNQKLTHHLSFRIISDLRVFRILRVLKIISHFLQLRIIIIALTKAFHSVMLISILVFIFAYIFANVGVVLFADMRNRIDDELVNDCFETINDALLTLFAVMTLDQWWKIFTNACDSNDNDLISTLYFMSWILLASFIFQNLFTGAMVNNFQQIREDIEYALNAKRLQNEKEAMIGTDNADKINLEDSCSIDELPVMDEHSSNMKTSSHDIKTNSQESVKRGSENNYEANDIAKKRMELKNVLGFMKNKHDVNKNWLKVSSNNIGDILGSIKISNKATLWPEDTLLHYYGLMQSLMDNLHERMILLDYANHVLLLMHDRDNTLFPLSDYENAMKKNN
jgi:voltage-gated sodium channel